MNTLERKQILERCNKIIDELRDMTDHLQPEVKETPDMVKFDSNGVLIGELSKVEEKESDWEKEFDTHFPRLNFGVSEGQIKTFIQAVLNAQHTKDIKEFREKVKRLKLECNTIVCSCGSRVKDCPHKSKVEEKESDWEKEFDEKWTEKIENGGWFSEFNWKRDKEKVKIFIRNLLSQPLTTSLKNLKK